MHKCLVITSPLIDTRQSPDNYVVYRSMRDRSWISRMAGYSNSGVLQRITPLFPPGWLATGRWVNMTSRMLIESQQNRLLAKIDFEPWFVSLLGKMIWTDKYFNIDNYVWIDLITTSAWVTTSECIPTSIRSFTCMHWWPTINVMSTVCGKEKSI